MSLRSGGWHGGATATAYDRCMQKREGEAPRPRRTRVTLKAAQIDAARAADDAWAWEAVYRCLTRIVELTVKGVRL